MISTSSFATDLFYFVLLTSAAVRDGVALQAAFPVSRTVQVRYGYFAEPRPLHVACARGWLDMYDDITETYYQVNCYPQSSGRVAAARLQSGELHFAHLGSTPLAEALARGLKLVLLYITQYAGDSQGIYVRPGSNITNPFDLVDKTIGVPFGSTMHYQVLFLLDLLHLKGSVHLLDLSPTEIVKAWDAGRIDVGACWGVARDYLLKIGGAGNSELGPANTLVSARVLSDWGRETFTMLVADEGFANEHQRFVSYATAILSHLNDSYLDRLGSKDPKNIDRWSASAPNSYTASMVDALMIAGETPGQPSDSQLFSQREALDAFVQPSAIEQISCAHLGTVEYYEGSSDSSLSKHKIQCKNDLSPIRLALKRTAEFLFDQKIIASYEDVFDPEMTSTDGVFLSIGYDFECATDDTSRCLPVGKYAQYGVFLGSNSTGEPFELLSMLEEMDLQVDAALPYEIGRDQGNSKCHTAWPSTIGESYPVTGSISDAEGPGDTYSDNIDCWTVIRANDCSAESSPCLGNVRVDIMSFRVWSGDFLRVYADATKNCDKNGKKMLLAQWSGYRDEGNGMPTPFPPVVAKGCLMVQFQSDGNSERAFRVDENYGNGFEISYNRNFEGCTDDSDCNGFPCGVDQGNVGTCVCGGLHWGADCSYIDHCLGTQTLDLTNKKTAMIASAASIHEEAIFNDNEQELTPYASNLDCTWELALMNVDFKAAVSYGKISARVELYFDLEDTHDFLYLSTGDCPAVTNTNTSYGVVTGSARGGAQVFFLPFDTDGKASLRFVTDFLGGKSGFVAYISVSDDAQQRCTYPGTNGYRCEIDHCLPNNKYSDASEAVQTLDQRHVVGRVVSQISDSTTSSISSSCKWPLPDLASFVAIRLAFHFPLNLEPHPAFEEGDQLIIRIDPDHNVTEAISISLYVEECIESDTCGSIWQTGHCINGTCDVKTTFDVQLPKSSDGLAGAIILETDRNDRGMDFKGVDFDLLLVQKCSSGETAKHCESMRGNKCVDGYCVCSGGIPCDCTCQGSPPFATTQLSILIGALVSICLIFIGIFFWYRRRKNRRSRAQKAIIAAKEAELDAFRESIVGMRTATTEYIPIGEKDPRERLQKSAIFASPEIPNDPQVTWCWQETSHLIQNHDVGEIVGDPSEGFIRFTAFAASSLENAFQSQNGHGTCIPLLGYTVNFDLMIQIKDSTGFQRNVKRIMELESKSQLNNVVDLDEQSTRAEIDLLECQFDDRLPQELATEPQMVLVTGDIVQITKTRGDGWAFGSKLHHADEVKARRLLSISTDGLEDKDDPNVFIDTGWFPLDATHLPCTEDLATLKANVGDSSALEPPDYWERVDDPTSVKICDLRPSVEEYEKVAMAFLSTLQPPSFDKKAEILSIHRVQNLAMYQSYMVKRQTICYRETGLRDAGKSKAEAEALQKRALRRFERRWLWHGTNREVLDKILAQGFNRSFAGKNATMYGKGVYFARDASYSAYPIYSIPDAKGTQYMLACRVAVGEYCIGRKDALTPDVRPGNDNMLFDSTVGLPKQSDTMANPSIFVTYHDAQAYPEYVIKFRLHDNSRRRM